eukprot:CAMPEP_0201475724 /NCGR_PEP_ID=MMETSP0151_2-20130828/1086_1 /ASSEMBLY_ACC=CAM_ASM_000257 /TAXON_ID=200890 /ORGANISM="Paramoeba atlantica, Strain 621/1 / CCAP 1560/9" /LENGTH=438 /DNA_ID=CAMNT_0047855887 /DNA_START=39 /DNA_END=1355 /DNA_ORIENTATION=+
MLARNALSNLVKSGRFPQTNVSSLGNSIRVTTAETASNGSTIGVFVNAGSSSESAEHNGISNILSRVAKNENAPEEGVFLTSFADREQFGVIAHTSGDSSGAVKSLSRALQAMKEGKDFEARREEALSDLNNIDMLSPDYTFDHLHSVAFQETPLSRTVSGNTKTLANITPEVAQDFVKTHFTGGRIVVAGAGGVSHDDVVSAASDAFGSIPDKSSFDFLNVPATEYTGSMVTIRDDTLPATSVAIAMRAPNMSHPDYAKLRVLQEVVGQWNRQFGSSWLATSPFVNGSIEEGKVASSFHAFSKSYRSTGLFGAFCLTSRDDSEDACYHIFKEWNRIAESATTTEVERAKQRLVSKLFGETSGTEGLVCRLGPYLLQTGSPYSQQDVLSSIESVTRDDVRNVATTYLIDQDPVASAVGQTGFFPDYNFLRGWTYWNRL